MHSEGDGAKACAKPLPSSTSIYNVFMGIQTAASDFNVVQVSLHLRKAKKAFLGSKINS